MKKKKDTIENKIVKELLSNCPIKGKNIDKIRKRLFKIYKITSNKTDEEIKKEINKKVKLITINHKNKIGSYKRIVKSISQKIKINETYDFIQIFIKTYLKALEEFINCWGKNDKFNQWIEKLKEGKSYNPENYNPLTMKKNINILEDLLIEIEMKYPKFEHYLNANTDFIVNFTNTLENLIEKLKIIEELENPEEKIRKAIETSITYTYALIEKYIKEKNQILSTDEEETKRIKEQRINSLKEIKKLTY